MPTIEVWMNSPTISCEVDLLSAGDDDFDEKDVSWFDVKFSLPETEQERDEKLAAVKEQIAVGVLNQSGIPHGVEVDPKVAANWKQQIKSSSFNNAGKRVKRRKGYHPNPQLTPLAKQLEKQLRKGRKK